VSISIGADVVTALDRQAGSYYFIPSAERLASFEGDEPADS
jgi:hypothetical protein